MDIMIFYENLQLIIILILIVYQHKARIRGGIIENFKNYNFANYNEQTKTTANSVDDHL